MLRDAKLWKRQNGAWGSSCGGVQDTGHHIEELGGHFTIWSIHDEYKRICTDVSRVKAEKAIAEDWVANDQG
jgi:hypothetical protein